MGVLAPAKRLIRRTMGVWPAMEWANKLVMGRALPRLTAFEDAEVARLTAQIGGRREARIAVIMPTYKRPEQLVQAAESVLRQEVKDFVLMIVDDGAGLPDNLPRDPRVTAVSLSRNSAVLGLVRNVGIRLTDSKFIAFLDDDNLWTPNHLTVTTAALEAGADLVYTAIRRRTAEGVELDILSREFDRRTFSDQTNYVDSNSIALKRRPEALFSRLPRTRKTLPKEDWEFVWRMSRGRKVQHVPVPTVEYLVNLESFYTNWDGVAPKG